MNIETTALKAALLRYSTNIPATGDEYDKLSDLADRLAEQIRGVVEAGGGVLLDDGVGFAMGENKAAVMAPVTLTLDAADVHNLAASCTRVIWPFPQFTPDMKLAVRELRKQDLPAWAQQAEDEAMIDRMTPERIRALAARVPEQPSPDRG